MTETLKDLIDLAKQRQGVRSGRQLAQLAQDHGHQIDRTQINDMAAGRYKAVPHAATIKALTWLSGVEESRVREAAGLAPAGEPFTPHSDADLLSNDEREAVNGIIRVITAGRRTARAGLEEAVAQELAEIYPSARIQTGVSREGHEPDLILTLDDFAMAIQIKNPDRRPRSEVELRRLQRAMTAAAERVVEEVAMYNESTAARTGVSLGRAEREALAAVGEESQDPWHDQGDDQSV